MSNNKKTFWVGALIGGVIGSVSALLFAPKSGRELRKDLAEGAQQIGERTQQLAKQIGEHTDEILASAKGKVASFKQGLNSWRQQDSEEEVQIATISSVSDSSVDQEFAWSEEEAVEVSIQDGEKKEEL